MQDYWGPICRFALRSGAGNLDNAEDVASQTFEVLWENRLLARWVASHTARFRSLLCGVVRKILANQRRVHGNRQRLAREMADYLRESAEATQEQTDVFYLAWTEALLQRAVDSLANHYRREAKGDYLRVLYGRLCQGLTLAETARSLSVSPTAVDHYYRHAKERLNGELREELLRQVQRYSPPEQIQQDFVQEWEELGKSLAKHGGLEQAVRRAYEQLDPVTARQSQDAAVRKSLTRITSIRPRSDGTSRPGETT
jgi:DNA-directed RNA polymerase specialized sigma24 family protein